MSITIGNSGSGPVRRMVGAAAIVGTLTMSARAQWTVVNLHPAGETGSSYAYGVQGGQQVGLISGATATRACMWTGTAASWVDLSPAGATSSEAWGVQGGQQVGWARIAGGNYRASLWTGSAASWVDLSPSAFEAQAFGLGGGQQVGRSAASGANRASLWTATAASWQNLNPAGVTVAELRGADGVQQVGDAVVGGTGHAGLWSGTPGSWVDLNPAGASQSWARGVSGGQQVGRANVGGVYRASMWNGTAASWVDLNPAGSTWSEAWGVYGGQQVGFSEVGGGWRASLWSGTAASWVNLHALLPPQFAFHSYAYGIWKDSGIIYVVGHGWNSTTSRNEALMWVWTPPTGACCAPDGACTVTTQANCAGNWTSGGTCTPNLCPQPGSCCAANGNCTVTLEANCTGIWTIGGTCSPNPCPQPTGACCAADGGCSVTTAAACVGTYQGDGTNCSPNPCSPVGACCPPSNQCQILTQSSCESGGGLYLGDGTICGECGANTAVPPSVPIQVNPGGGNGDPTEDSLITIMNNTGGAGTISVGETASNPHPQAGGFEALNKTLVIETSLPNGQFFMTVQVPFALVDLAGADPLQLNLSYFNAATSDWELAVDGNTVDSPGHATRRGDRSVQQDGAAPVVSTDLGDYGVYWNPGTGKGFVWANVDHTTDFSPGLPPRGDLDCSGAVTPDDVSAFVLALIDPGAYSVQYPVCSTERADMQPDGNVDGKDVQKFVDQLMP